MKKITKYIKTDLYVSEVDGKEFTDSKACEEYTKNCIMQQTVKGLQSLGFWKDYNIPNIEFEGKVYENLAVNPIVFSNNRSFLLAQGKHDNLWVKVSIRGKKMILLAFKSSEAKDQTKWKFLGEVDLTKVATAHSAYSFNMLRNSKLLSAWNDKMHYRRSALTKLTDQEKKALNIK